LTIGKALLSSRQSQIVKRLLVVLGHPSRGFVLRLGEFGFNRLCRLRDCTWSRYRNPTLQIEYAIPDSNTDFDTEKLCCWREQIEFLLILFEEKVYKVTGWRWHPSYTIRLGRWS
jgi:hypothetical protein